MNTLAFFSPLEEANRLFSESNFEEAAKAFRQVTEEDPNNAFAWKGLGLCYANLGQMQDAVDACLEATRLMPGSAELHYAHGYTLLRAKRFTEAITELDKVLILQPQHNEAKKSLVFALLHEAQLLLDLDPPRAAIMLERAYRYEPRNPHTIAPYLEALFRTNQRGKAGRIIVDTPDWIRTHEEVAPVLSRIRSNPEFAEVVRQFEQAEKQNVVRPELISPVMHNSRDMLSCPNCLAQIPYVEDFCPYCGVKISRDLTR